jgi:probable HAF family extracellular repeat protein
MRPPSSRSAALILLLMSPLACTDLPNQPASATAPSFSLIGSYEMVDLGPADVPCTYGVAINSRGQAVLGSCDNTRFFFWDRDSVTDIGTLGGNYVQASALNDAGQVIGNSMTADGAIHGFFWENGHITDLGDFHPRAINVKGQVAGIDPQGRGFLRDHGTMTDLGTLGGSRSVPTAMNDRGQVVGLSDIADDRRWHAFLWDHGTMIDLHGADDNWTSGAVLINSEGLVAGDMFHFFEEVVHTWVWQRGTWTDLKDLGLDSDGADAQAISPTGVIGGTATFLFFGDRAWVWTRGTVTVIPELASVAAINAAGVVVGSPGLPGYAGLLLWYNGTVVDIGPEGGFGSASGINAAGQIIGTTFPGGGGGDSRAVMWSR